MGNQQLLQQLKSKWIGLIRTNSMIENGVDILHKIEREGFQALIVGGSVRDLVGGINPHDIDIATNAPLHVLDRLFDTYDIGASRSFGIVLVNQGGHSFEIAQFRHDGEYTDGRRPDEVFATDDFFEDAKRRDFRFNAMGITKEGDIIDHFDGIKSMSDKVVDTIGFPSIIFNDDFLRIIRSIRFSVRMGFKLSSRVEESIRINRKSLRRLAPERIKDELWKMASEDGPTFVKAIQLMDELGVLEIILPEVSRMKNVFESEVHHPEAHEFGEGRVFDHVLHAMRQNDNVDQPLINLAILFHDLGKADTSEVIEGRQTFHNHDSVGGVIIKSIAVRLRMSREERESLIFPAVNHMKLFRGHEMKASKIVGIVNDPNWNLLKIVSLCDDKCRGSKKFDPIHFDSVISRMETVTDKWNNKPSGIKVIDGNQVQEICGIEKPCKLVGDIIRNVSEFVINNDITDQNLIEELVRFSFKLLTEE